VVYGDGKQVVELNLWKYSGKIKEGDRDRTLGKFSMILIAINPSAKPENLFRVLNWINRTYCVVPLTDREVFNIVDDNYKKAKDKGITLEAEDFVTRYIFWHPDCPLPAEHKHKKGLAAFNAMKKGNKEAVIRTTILALMDNGVKITKPLVVEQSGIPIATLKRYWKTFKADVENFNHDLKTKGIINPSLGKGAVIRVDDPLLQASI
jgi:hypothetical protein